MSDNIIRLPAFSIHAKSLQGELPLSDFARLCRLLPVPPSGMLAYNINGGKDADGLLFLTVELSAQLPLICTHCLELFDFTLNTTQRFWLRGGALPAVSNNNIGEELDAGDIPLAEFLTDELLLSLPQAPAHKSADCRLASSVLSKQQQRTSSHGCTTK